ncbi:RHS repeat-associated core domain-containing protein [Catenulispora subtropica]|uniref:RHS repeat-associated core domain-containing protein n=1 Tax=Catenulispora subtropica TaxID=450798 RepID=UPI0031D9C0DA
MVESVEALAKQFGDFAHDVEAAYRSLNSFGGDAAALQWVGQTADAFKSNFGPLPGRLQKLYTSYSEASDALSAYAPKLLAAQNKADAALRQALDAHADLQRATTTAHSAASDLKTAQQNQVANPNQQAVTDAQAAHDTAQKNLDAAKSKMDALAAQAKQAYDDRISAAKDCAKALHHAQSDGIHNKHWWEHVGEFLSEWGGKIAEIANDLAPFLDVLALATSWIPGVDVVTAALAEADNLVALAGTGLEIAGDAMQGHWGDALMGAGMLGVTFLGGKALGALGGKVLGKLGTEAEGEERSLVNGATKDAESDAGNLAEHTESDIGGETRRAEGASNGVCETDPVDVVSGWMLSEATDLRLPGVMPVLLRRVYASGYETGRLFGPGWSSTLDQRLSVNAAGIHFAGDDAQCLDYPIPADGEEVLPVRGTPWPLRWDRGVDEIRITDPWSGRTHHFGAVHHQSEAGQIRDLVAITDRNGNQVSILRHDDGTPTGLEHPGYRLAVDTVPAPGGPRVTAIRLLDGSERGVVVKRYQYDDRGRLTGVVDSSGVPFGYEWDEADRITAWVDRVGYRYRYEYDDRGRVVRTVGDGGFLSGSFAYDPAARETTFTDSLGGTVVYGFDRSGHVSRRTDPLGYTTVSEYDERGRLITSIDPLGNAVRYVYDEHGDLVRLVGPDGAAAEVGHDDRHLAVSVGLPDGSRRTRSYDERGNLVAEIDPVGAPTRYTYRSNGAVESVTDAAGAVTWIECDRAGLVVAVVDPLGGRTEVRRDAFGRVVEVVDALGMRTGYGWSVEGRALWRTEPDGGRISWDYDAEGQLVRAVDPLGATVLFEPGPFGRIAARTGPDGVRHEFARDSELRLRSVTKAGAVWSYDWDVAGRLLRETDFIGRALSYEYDAAGRLVSRSDAGGQRITLERDAAGRLIRRRTPDGEYAYRYDAVGRLATAVGPDSRLEYTRDAAGRVLSESVDGRTVTSGYDRTGRRVLRTTPGGSVSRWEYDAAGGPSVLSTDAGRLTFSLDAAGREAERVLNGRVHLSRDHDVAGRVIGQRLWTGDAGNPVAELLNRQWTRRADGLPTRLDDSASGGTRYVFDGAGRVTEAVGTDWSEQYSYDEFGNVTSGSTPADPDPHPETASDGVRDADRTLIRRAGRTRYEHDDSGRLIRTVRTTLDGRRRTWEYTWDASDRLHQVTTPDGATWRYRYDPLGRRIAKARLLADGTTTDETLFTWDGLRLAEQHSVSPVGTEQIVTWDYEPGTHRPAAQTRRVRHRTELSQDQADVAFYAIVTDLIGTPTELVTSEGHIAWRTTTDLWGRPAPAASAPVTDCPLRFPGQYHDAETGLHYNLHRYYNPATASFLTPDPLGLSAAPNDHAYVPNPLVWADPLGLKCYSEDELCDVTELKGDEPGTAQRLMEAPEYNGGQLRGFRNTNNPDFLDERGRTYDAVGGPTAWTNPDYNEAAMHKSVWRHIYAKSGFDYTVLDLSGASSHQIDRMFTKLDEWDANPKMKALNKLIILGDSY